MLRGSFDLCFIKRGAMARLTLRAPAGMCDAGICFCSAMRIFINMMMMSTTIILFVVGGGGHDSCAAAGRRSILMSANSSSSTSAFVFGDSLVDVGNNNYIPTSLAKANHPHFGVDFSPSKGLPTGRFSNGRTVQDIIAERLGQPFAPPYLAPQTHGRILAYGVNYASGGAGILNETGEIFMGRLPLDLQVAYFRRTKMELVSILGQKATQKILASSLVTMTIGANDFLNNYLLPIPTSADKLMAPTRFIKHLTSQLRRQLKRIYDVGARKIVVVAVPPIGCTPFQRALFSKPNGSCVEASNQVVAHYNAHLKSMVQQLNSELPHVSMLFADAYAAALDILKNHQQHGLEELNKACCGLGGPENGLIPCRPNFEICADRSKYFFWDPFHPTEAVNLLLADRFLTGGIRYVTPFNITQLMAL